MGSKRDPGAFDAPDGPISSCAPASCAVRFLTTCIFNPSENRNVIMINVSRKNCGGYSTVAGRANYRKRTRRTSNLALERLESRVVLTNIDGTTIGWLGPSTRILLT